MIALLIAAGDRHGLLALLTPLFIRLFRRLNLGQYIRDDTPQTHVLKRGTPSMGGVVFIIGRDHRLLRRPAHRAWPADHLAALLVILMMVGLALIGFIDDLLKVEAPEQPRPGRPLEDRSAPSIVGIVFAILALNSEDANGVPTASTASPSSATCPFDFVVDLRRAGSASSCSWSGSSSSRPACRTRSTSPTGSTGWPPARRSSRSAPTSSSGSGRPTSPASARVAEENIFKCYTCASPLDLADDRRRDRRGAHRIPLVEHLARADHHGRHRRLRPRRRCWRPWRSCRRTELLLILIGGLFVIVTGSVILQRAYFKITKGKRIWRRARCTITSR